MTYQATVPPFTINTELTCIQSRRSTLSPLQSSFPVFTTYSILVPNPASCYADLGLELTGRETEDEELARHNGCRTSEPLDMGGRLDGTACIFTLLALSTSSSECRLGRCSNHRLHRLGGTDISGHVISVGVAMYQSEMCQSNRLRDVVANGAALTAFESDYLL